MMEKEELREVRRNKMSMVFQNFGLSLTELFWKILNMA